MQTSTKKDKTSQQNEPVKSFDKTSNIQGNPIFRLQRTFGNQAVMQLLRRENKQHGTPQKISSDTKEIASSIDPAYAPETGSNGDRTHLTSPLAAPSLSERSTPPMASRAIRRTVQTKVIDEKKDDLLETEADFITDKKLFRMASDTDPTNPTAPAVENALGQAGQGEPLPEAFVEKPRSQLGIDLSQVRIHTNETANHAAQALNAKAFTTGEDIYFAHGAYSPADGESPLLVHELTHVIQHQQGRINSIANRTVSNPSDSLEVEAHAMRSFTDLRQIVPTQNQSAMSSASPSNAIHRDQAPALGKDMPAQIKKITQLANLPDGKGMVNVLGNENMLAIDTLVQITGDVSQNGWFPIIVKEGSFVDKEGYLMPGYLKPVGAVSATNAPAEEKPVKNNSGNPAQVSLSAPGYATTTVAGDGTMGGAQLLDKIGGINILGGTNGLAMGTLVHLEKDLGNKVFQLTVVDEKSPYKDKRGIMTGAWLQTAAAPAPKEKESKKDDQNTPVNSADSQKADPATSIYIHSNMSPNAVAKAEIEYRLISPTPLQYGTLVKWFHFRVVNGENQPENEHGYPGLGLIHKHVFEAPGQYVIKALINEDTQLSFSQNVIDVDDKESPLTKGKEDNHPVDAELWKLNRDAAAQRKLSTDTLQSSSNPADIGGQVEFSVIPLVTAKSFFWFILPLDFDSFQKKSESGMVDNWSGEWRGMTKQEYRNRKVLVSPMTGSNMSFPASVTGKYIICCEERDGEGKELRTNQLVQSIQMSNPAAAKKEEEFVKESDDTLALIAKDEQGKRKAVPVRAEFLAKTRKESSHLTFFIGPKSDGKGLVLVDLQRGISNRNYEGANSSACFDEFALKRSYPDGWIAFDVSAKPDWGVDAFSKTITVEPSKTDKAIAFVGQLAGLAAAPAFFIVPPLGAVFQIISSAANIYENWHTGQLVSEKTAIDVMAIAAAFVPLGGALAERLAAARLVDVADKVGKYTHILGMGSGVTNGILLEQQSIKQLAEINNSNDTPEEKQRRMAEALFNMVNHLILLAVVVKETVESISGSKAKPTEAGKKMSADPDEEMKGSGLNKPVEPGGINTPKAPVTTLTVGEVKEYVNKSGKTGSTGSNCKDESMNLGERIANQTSGKVLLELQVTEGGNGKATHYYLKIGDTIICPTFGQWFNKPPGPFILVTKASELPKIIEQCANKWGGLKSFENSTELYNAAYREAVPFKNPLPSKDVSSGKYYYTPIGADPSTDKIK